ncbi:ER membrane complex subunit 6 [Phlyctochytrium bullatum]|nr:ER membrane complex subunit 6 [Phlyctochytrium bullatum]
MLAAVAGAAAGILGFQGISGFLFYFAASALMSLALVALPAKFQPAKYFPMWWMILTHEVFGSLFSYVLFWTLVYGLVHVYD